MLTDVVADAVTADVDVVSEIAVVSGLFFCSSAVADAAMDLDATMVVAAITVVCGSSCFLSAAVDAATDLVSTTVVVMDADATAVADADSFDFLKHFCFFIISITFARGDFFTPSFFYHIHFLRITLCISAFC